MKSCLFFVLFFYVGIVSYAQDSFKVLNGKKSHKIQFKLINNLVIIPVEVNNVKLSFLLDTGVSKPIIFNLLHVEDSLKLQNTETIELMGFGDGEPIKATKSTNNVIKIGDAIKLNQDFYAVYDADLNLAPRLGIPVHGIIGYDLFKDLTVEINYSRKFIRLTEPEFYKYKKKKNSEKIHLEFYNNKPYINAEVELDKIKIPVKLLIDSGGSDALWLFEEDEVGIHSGNHFFYDFLGHGLSGSVFGKRSKVDAFYLKSFYFSKVNVAYPDSSSVVKAKHNKARNGSLSGNILKRFNVVFDYPTGFITLKKNGFFKEKFKYNRSGIELAHNGVRIIRELDQGNIIAAPGNNPGGANKNTIVIDPKYTYSLKPAFVIVELRNDSPAALAGLKIGDMVLSINNKETHRYKLQDLMYMFYDDIGKRIQITVERRGVILNFEFKLKSPY
ncbi:aspartyl protease family protein [Neotamlana laminarinivorans]|uniref:Aspartyl protease family protein n=1 Tax=Neotamlana laminarinivorans TaxID=2883124 RepID=A0A9X1HZX1_9FLAO|nr:PDZ domain-containing protein [Tamlana laminarinivorans]MCB4798865.1 aspartyl protease family protein [Tamlana laminarinivorans]